LVVHVAKDRDIYDTFFAEYIEFKLLELNSKDDGGGGNSKQRKREEFPDALDTLAYSREDLLDANLVRKTLNFKSAANSSEAVSEEEAAQQGEEEASSSEGEEEEEENEEEESDNGRSGKKRVTRKKLRMD